MCNSFSSLIIFARTRLAQLPVRLQARDVNSGRRQPSWLKAINFKATSECLSDEQAAAGRRVGQVWNGQTGSGIHVRERTVRFRSSLQSSENGVAIPLIIDAELYSIFPCRLANWNYYCRKTRSYKAHFGSRLFQEFDIYFFFESDSYYIARFLTFHKLGFKDEQSLLTHFI